MKLNAPKKFTFWASVGLFVPGVIVAFNVLPFIPRIIGVIAMAVAFILIALGNILKGF